MPVSSENVHFVLPDIHSLPIPSARFLSNDETMRLVIHYLLLQFILCCLLVANRLQGLDHGLCCGRVGTLFANLVWFFAKLFKKLFFLFHEFLLLILIQYLFHHITIVVRFIWGDSPESNFVRALGWTFLSISFESWGTIVNAVS